MEYFVNEGNKMGFVDTSYSNGSNGITEHKLVAGADITKGQVVELTDSFTVAPTSAASANVLGVAMYDAKTGSEVAVECEGLFKLTAAAAITAPTRVESAAGGKVATIGEVPVKPIGVAIGDAEQDGPVYVKFSI